MSLNSDAKNSFVDFFGDLPDPRIDRKREHKLIDIFVVALCAVLSGAETWVEIEEFGNMKIKWLRRFVALENGIPSHDTFGRVFSMVDPDEFGARFMGWIQQVCKRKSKNKLVAIDGKTLRRSYDNAKGKAAIHIISAWGVENGICLGQHKTGEKSNEITAIPELLNLLDINGCIISIDAMGCQKKIAKQITNSGADYVLGLKGNQTKLRNNVEEFFRCAERDDFEYLKYDTCKTVEKDHGRIETREYWIVAEDSFEVKNEWGGLSAVGMVKSERNIDGVSTYETRYFLSSSYLSAKEFAKSVRGHWGIENCLHWVLDVAFREDECRIRKGHAAENVSTLRRFALNLLREDKTVCKLGIKGKRFRCAIDEEYLSGIMGF